MKKRLFLTISLISLLFVNCSIEEEEQVDNEIKEVSITKEDISMDAVAALDNNTGEAAIE